MIGREMSGGDKNGDPDDADNRGRSAPDPAEGPDDTPPPEEGSPGKGSEG